MRLARRWMLSGVRLWGIVLVAMAGAAVAQDIRFFEIGTGPTDDTRFVLGGLVANALSNPPGSRDCDRGGSCGVPGMVAVAKSSGGSVANVEALAGRRLDAALVRADIADDAYRGAGAFAARGAVPSLRTVAMLYRESLHLVVRKAAKIASVRDLKGKRVAFGERGTAGMAHGRLLLGAYGLSESQVRLSVLSPAAAAEALAAGRLDAMLVEDVLPVSLLAELAQRVEVTLLPLAGPEIDRLLSRNPVLSAAVIPAGTYKGQAAEIRTLDMGVVLVTDAHQPEGLIRAVTGALSHPSSRRLMAEGYPRGVAVAPTSVGLDRLGVPLHPGAAAYYAEPGAAR